MKENLIKDKSFDFAVRIVNLHKFLTTDKKEFTMSCQVLRSGTSIGANISEATQAISTADFIAKLSISLKEASETDFWINLLHRTGYIDDVMYKSLIFDCQELIKMLTSIIKTSRNNNNNN
jgi:four helix bundle protein